MPKSMARAAFAVSTFVLAAGAAHAADKTKRGEYLATIMDCGGCHTRGALTGKPEANFHLAGSQVGFQIPELGVFYPPNLTPDQETGLGSWTRADIVKAVRAGLRPDGRKLVPVMPYHNYGKLTDRDADALAAYLQSLKPVRHAVPAITQKPEAPYLTVVVPK